MLVTPAHKRRPRRGVLVVYSYSVLVWRADSHEPRRLLIAFDSEQKEWRCGNSLLVRQTSVATAITWTSNSGLTSVWTPTPPDGPVYFDAAPGGCFDQFDGPVWFDTADGGRYEGYGYDAFGEYDYAVDEHGESEYYGPEDADQSEGYERGEDGQAYYWQPQNGQGHWWPELARPPGAEVAESSKHADADAEATALLNALASDDGNVERPKRSVGSEKQVRVSFAEDNEKEKEKEKDEKQVRVSFAGDSKPSKPGPAGAPGLTSTLIHVASDVASTPGSVTDAWASSSRFDWTIPGDWSKLKSYAVDAHESSPSFDLRGSVGMKLEFYPNGTKATEAGFMTLKLTRAAHNKGGIKFALSLNGRSTGPKACLGRCFVADYPKPDGDKAAKPDASNGPKEWLISMTVLGVFGT